MITCQGSCLKHCYAKNSLVLFSLGLISGYLLSNFYTPKKYKN